MMQDNFLPNCFDIVLEWVVLRSLFTDSRLVSVSFQKIESHSLPGHCVRGRTRQTCARSILLCFRSGMLQIVFVSTVHCLRGLWCRRWIKFCMISFDLVFHQLWIQISVFPFSTMSFNDTFVCVRVCSDVDLFPFLFFPVAFISNFLLCLC